MISICIPVYNFDVTNLVNALLLQLEGTSEIILIDDASVEETQRTNQKLESSKVKLVQLEKNVGRAKIRNLFVRYAQNPYLIFLDCDAKITSTNYLLNYRALLNKDVQIVCGGSVYSEESPSLQQILRWKYGKFRESKSATIRSLNPYSSFLTSNFLIKKTIFEKVRFDERIVQYGHEDTLFGIELEEHGLSIKHIDNPVENDDIDSNEVFIKKTETALVSLFQIYSFYSKREHLEKHISLLRIARKVKLKWAISLFFFVFKGLMKKHLIHSKNPSMNIFNVYKLGYYLSLKKVKNDKNRQS